MYRPKIPRRDGAASGSGFSITVTGTDNYTFTLGSTPTITEQSGGMTVTAGPVTLNA